MIGGHDEWDLEASFYINHRGIDPEKARLFVILRWMWHGNFKPLAAAIREGGPLDDAILSMLAKMIDEDRLKLAHTGKHRPKDPASVIKGVLAALAYEHSNQQSSDDRFRHVAEMLGMSEEAVRGHVTAWRKGQKKWAQLAKG
jgi:hypothetical protein